MARSRAAGERTEAPDVNINAHMGGYSDSGLKKVSAAMSDPQSAVLAAMSEREFQRKVVEGLEQRGWLVFVVPDMRRTLAGLPDLLCLHARRPVLLAWELKTETGRSTWRQRTVLALFDRVPGVDARVLRPSDWASVRDELDRTAPPGAPSSAQGER